MNPRLLKTFLAVARCRSATRAAGELNLAQSSVSDQIQSLEDELGTTLFVRSKQGFRLTGAGRALLPFAENILATTDEAIAAVKMADLAADLSLVVGTLETVAAETLPALLSDLRRTHPKLRMRIEVAGSDHLMQSVLDGSNDVAFCFRKGTLDNRLVRREVAQEPMIFIGSPTTGENPKRLDLTALSDAPFIATEPGCVYRHLLDEACRQVGMEPVKPFAEVGSIDAIVRLVAAGSGYALLPRLAVREALERGTVRALGSVERELAATLDMVWRRRRVQPPGLSLLLARMEPLQLSLKRGGDPLPREAPYRL